MSRTDLSIRVVPFFTPSKLLPRLKSGDAIKCRRRHGTSRAFTPGRLSAGNADSTLQIFKEQTADFHRAARARTLHRDLLLRSLERLLEQSTGQCVRVWWRMTGSNRRPPACKAGALPAELIPRLVFFGRWWAWLDSNQRPPPYQDGALTD